MSPRARHSHAASTVTPELTQKFVGSGLAVAFGVGHGEAQRTVRAPFGEFVHQRTFLVGLLVLQRRQVESEALALDRDLHILGQAVGLDVVQPLRLSEQHDIAVVGVDLLIDPLVRRRVGGNKSSRTR